MTTLDPYLKPKREGSTLRKNPRFSLPGAILAAAAFAAPMAAQAQGGPNVTSTTIMQGREFIWDMAFLPDGTMFFTEKCRGLSVRLPSGTTNALLGIGDWRGYPDTAADLFCDGQAGLSGVAIDPNFAQDRFIYISSASRIAHHQHGAQRRRSGDTEQTARQPRSLAGADRQALHKMEPDVQRTGRGTITCNSVDLGVFAAGSSGLATDQSSFRSTSALLED